MKALIISPKEEKVKERLQQSILRKRKALEEWMEKVEILKMELELIKNEYTVRIGYLLLKDNQLDLEIIQHKNLKRLMDEGMTYEEALQAEEDTFYNEILRMQKEQERIEEEKCFFESRQEIPEEMEEDLKTLWKKLIRRFHPDLASDVKEKQKREHLMKQINLAYGRGDIEALLLIENNADSEKIEEVTKEKLERVLTQTENLLKEAKKAFQELLDTQWYIWKEKKEKFAKFSGEDIFADLEKKLLDDVVKKITILRDLRKAIGLTT